ncbi:hypothetical protein HH214_07705 [Mucilaginibacter robiniae]|uniref:Lipoprotein SmpA/OmlA domain-containing protein n=1 Tax=Mucilaginibacter robiniae TaxID=2728022 RepID=A0A7L5DXC8_9SPHI|nr:hypothetical protein [Mucilaginibacter robiniae]QJD95762.1 hypothetical protein HH214_07705 [Mucilaginibacter robiniae]
MTKPIKTLLTFVLASVLTSCATLKGVDLTAIKIGMSKTEVQAALKKKPDNIVAAKHYTDPETIIEVVQYTGAGQTRTYYLYFVNDKLDKWHEVGPNEGRPII